MKTPRKEIVEPSSVLVITVHKARNVERKGFIGKADPFVRVNYRHKDEDSSPVIKNMNPVWNFTVNFNLYSDDAENKVSLTVLDNSTKDSSLGYVSISLDNFNNFVHQWIPLAGCKTGEVLVSCKKVSGPLIHHSVGHLSLVLHKGERLEKKQLLRKADPYVVCKLGNDIQTSKTIASNQSPEWNFHAEFEVTETSPGLVTFEVFDENNEKDASLGNSYLDIKKFLEEPIMNRVWCLLDNCKSGQLLISAEFTPAAEEVDIDALEVVEDIHDISMSNGSQDASETPIDFITPIYCDESFIVVPKNSYNWFMVR